jgi:Tol biopolymer transport system component
VPKALFLVLPIVLLSWAALGSSSTGDFESTTQTPARIAFIRGNGQLVTVDPDGRNERIVVRLRAGFSISGFTWAPGGRRIALSTTTPLGKERLYVVGVNGRGLRRLAQWEDSGSVLWAPHGRTILFDKHHDGEHQLWTIKPDGSGARKLTPVPGDRPGGFSSPTWSPNGRRIACSGPKGIYVMRANGRGRRLVIREATGPVWSPANKIAYYVGDDLWIANPDGSGRRIAIKDGPESYEPGGIEFSPDGRRVAFSAHYSVGNRELVIGEVSTGNVGRLTTNDMDDWPPHWSPDGRSLAFERYRRGGYGAGEIYLINVDGTGERNLTNSAANEYWVEWAPR